MLDVRIEQPETATWLIGRRVRVHQYDGARFDGVCAAIDDAHILIERENDECVPIGEHYRIALPIVRLIYVRW
jgi:hypothetical protein